MKRLYVFAEYPIIRKFLMLCDDACGHERRNRHQCGYYSKVIGLVDLKKVLEAVREGKGLEDVLIQWHIIDELCSD